MLNTEIYFLERARAFKKAELEYIKYIYETKRPENEDELKNFNHRIIELAFEAIEIRNEILGEMHDVSEIQIHDSDVKETIRKLKAGDRFESVAFAEKLAELMNKDIDNYYKQIKTDVSSYFEENYDKFQDDFFSGFSIPEYYFLKAQVGTIITTTKLPKNIGQYFDEIKDAYAYGLDRSCISLSRVILEIALYKRLQDKGVIKRGKVSHLDYSRDDSLSLLINDAFRIGLLGKFQKDLAHEVRKTANNVLHIKDNVTSSLKGNALRTISRSVEVIEYLFK